MLNKIQQLFLFTVFLCVLPGCSNPTDEKIIKGNVVEVSTLYGFNRIEVRIDCKNITCDTKTFYFKKYTPSSSFNDNDRTMMYRALSSQEFNNKIIIYYNSFFLFNKINNIYINEI